MARASSNDKLFGSGEPGAADRALAEMKRLYGRKGGQTVFDATILKRKRKGGKPAARKAKR